MLRLNIAHTGTAVARSCKIQRRCSFLVPCITLLQPVKCVVICKLQAPSFLIDWELVFCSAVTAWLYDNDIHLVYSAVFL